MTLSLKPWQHHCTWMILDVRFKVQADVKSKTQIISYTSVIFFYFRLKVKVAINDEVLITLCSYVDALSLRFGQADVKCKTVVTSTCIDDS